MSSRLPEEWKVKVRAILASGDLKKILIRQRARRDWSMLFPNDFDFDLIRALGTALEKATLEAKQVIGMEEEGEVYEIIFVHHHRDVYSKINLCPDGTVVIIYSAHRPLKGNKL